MDDLNNFPILHKRGVGGEVRTWRMELHTPSEDEAYHRVLSGVLGGTEAETGWSEATPKNVGRSNATTAREQAVAEIEAKYQIKRERGYFDDVAEIDNLPFTKPMLAHPWEKRADKIDWDNDSVWTQPKLDGIRCIARADGLFTRTGKPIVAVPHIARALEKLFRQNPDLILDGELYNHELREDFNSITSIVRKTKPTEEDVMRAADAIQYHVYDIVDPTATFWERMTELDLTVLTAGLDERVIVTVHTILCRTQEELDDAYSGFMAAGYEGQMVRFGGTHYEMKRSNHLLKRKDFESAEFEVVDVEEGNGNWRGYAKRFILRGPDGSTFGAGVRGTQSEMIALLRAVQAGDGPTWATCRYQGLTPDGVPRFPVVIDHGVGERED